MEKYHCVVCENNFSSKSALSRHKIEMHSKAKKGETRYCELCEKEFTQIKAHLKAVHEDLRNFTCDICEKTFRVTRELKLHY